MAPIAMGRNNDVSGLSERSQTTQMEAESSEDEGEMKYASSSTEMVSGTSDSATTPTKTPASNLHPIDNNIDNQLLPPIQQISLIGERNSGTRWIYEHLTECFGRQITVKRRLVRYKHWFQHDVIPDVRVNGTLVIAQFRDPMLWVDGMRRKPRHAPMHCNLDWKDFVKTPWTMPERPKFDVETIREIEQNHSLHDNDTLPPCQEYFEPHQIISCLLFPFTDEEDYRKYMKYWRGDRPIPKLNTGRQPFYELKNDGSGNHYKDILSMRADKIRNFLSIKEWDWIDDVHVVQYERMIHDGTEGLLGYVEERTGLKANCSAFEAQPDRTPNPLDADFVDWINKNHDWKTEALIGYKKWKF